MPNTTLIPNYFISSNKKPKTQDHTTKPLNINISVSLHTQSKHSSQTYPKPKTDPKLKIHSNHLYGGLQ